MKDINGHKAFPVFPVYRVSVKWAEDGIKNPEYPKRFEGLPDGKIWNGTGFCKMFKEEQTLEQLDIFVNDWWKLYIGSEKNKDKEITNLKLSIEFVEFETWYLTWFQHETFDIGQTDAEALNSFEEFVNRREHWNHGRTLLEQKTLMGAEDRYRWHGSGETGDSDEHSPAPCRCKHCKEQGLLRIAH